MIEPSENALLAGKYRLLRKLGQGGMGSVWLAEHLTLRSQVAIKLINIDIAGNSEVLSRFLREAQSAAGLRSPHVVQILDHGIDEGRPYIAMELLDGESLADRLTRVGRIAPLETARILTHIGRAIGRAHEAGIVHRDLKPDNVFLVRNDDEEIAKVLDFGVAKATAPGSLGASASSGTRTGAVLGTPYYMSPEQAEGARTLDHRADIWAMGVIAFECLLGRRPFEAQTLGGLLLDICARPIAVPSHCGLVPPGFDAWFARACARDLNFRFASARDAALELKRVCEGATDGQSSYPAQPSTGAGAPGGQTRVGLSAGGTGGGTIVGQSVAAFSTSSPRGSLPPPSKSRSGLVVALVGLVVVAAGGAVAAWSHFKAEPTLATSASIAPPTAAVASAPPPVTASVSALSVAPGTPAHVEVPVPSAPTVTPKGSAAVAALPSAKLAASVSTKHVAAVHAAPVTPHVVGAVPHAAPTPEPVVSAPPQPAHAEPKAAVNLGI